MVIYQLESLHLDYYNLTYSQNKYRVFETNLTATHLKPHHFLYTKISQNQSKPIKTTKHNLEQPPKLVYNQNKHFHPKNMGFQQPNIRKEKIGFGFHTFNPSIPSILLPLDLSKSWLLGEKSPISFLHKP